MSRIAVYPGSFDPVTNGHIDIIRRAAKLFDKVFVVVADNASKKYTFDVSERTRMISESIQGLKNAEADTFSGLIVDYLKAKKARVLIRGMRAISDMDYEFQMASMNRHLYPEVETVFLMPDERYTHLSSSIIKEVLRLGARAEDTLPAPVVRMLRGKLGPKKKRR